MATWAGSEEAGAGRYSWVSGGPIVQDPGIDNMTLVIAGLIETDKLSGIFRRLESKRPRS
ncbi:hypothetical protein [Streptomyces clavifer]|uniref:hypothetical protein n=1 Tax=Streptomyces clavifer TaxID=68188 RepID=UPI0036C40D0A